MVTTCIKILNGARHQWLMPAILATQEAEEDGWLEGHPGQIVHETLSQKTLSQKRAGGEAQGVAPEFKPWY
jgi:hypothetical protein